MPTGIFLICVRNKINRENTRWTRNNVGCRTGGCRTGHYRPVGNGQIHRGSLLQAAVGAFHIVAETGQVCRHPVSCCVGGVVTGWRPDMGCVGGVKVAAFVLSTQQLPPMCTPVCKKVTCCDEVGSPTADNHSRAQVIGQRACVCVHSCVF
jgi:hypothetical protein